MAKAGTSVVKVEFILVSLKSIYLAIPKKDKEKLQLVDDLTKMGCEGLILELWEVKSEAMVQEFRPSAPMNGKAPSGEIRSTGRLTCGHKCIVSGKKDGCVWEELGRGLMVSLKQPSTLMMATQ